MRSLYTVGTIGHYLAQRDGGWRCHYCGRRIYRNPDEIDILAKEKLLEATIDHKHALSRGGADKPHNLVLCCKLCNQEKGAQDYLFFRALTRPRRVKNRMDEVRL